MSGRALAVGRERVGDAVRVARYLRQLRSFRVRPDDVFISSYPRSGTTWMQLVVHMVRGHELEFEHIAHVVPWFERPLALGRNTARDFARIARARSFKSHLPHAWLPRGARYLYVCRDGRDVATSYYHFYCSHLGYRGDFDAFFQRFLSGRLQYGSWFRHVADWQRLAWRSDVCVVRYEELHRDPEQQLHRIADLCGVRLEAKRCRAILEAISFDAMKQREGHFDHARAEPRSQVSPGAFLRRGCVGDHRALLSPAHERAFARAQADSRAHRFPELRLPLFLH